MVDTRNDDSEEFRPNSELLANGFATLFCRSEFNAVVDAIQSLRNRPFSRPEDTRRGFRYRDHGIDRSPLGLGWMQARVLPMSRHDYACAGDRFSEDGEGQRRDVMGV